MTDSPPPRNGRGDRWVAASVWIQIAALAGFLAGVAAWSSSQFAWPRWLVLVALLGVSFGCSAYRRRRAASQP